MYASSGVCPLEKNKVLDAGFLPFLQPVFRFMVPMGVIWHALCLYFGVLEDPGTILGRSWDDLGTLEGTRKDPMRPFLGDSKQSMRHEKQSMRHEI